MTAIAGGQEETGTPVPGLEDNFDCILCHFSLFTSHFRHMQFPSALYTYY